MGLFDKIFRPDREEAKDALHGARATFHTLTGYRPVFTSWNGAIYESELVRAAIDARARHISKLKLEIGGSAKPALQAKMRQGPNQWQTYPQFLYRISTILDCDNTCFIVPVFNAQYDITGYFPVLPRRAALVEYEGEPWLRYQFANGRTAAVELRLCAVLTKYQYQSDFFGDTNSALDDTMRLIHIQNQGIEEGVKNSASYRFVAQVNNFTKNSDLAKERAEFTKENLSDDAQAKGGLLLFPNTYKDIKQITQSPYTPDPKQTELIHKNIFNYFGVNEDVLQNKAYGDSWSAFYEGGIEPFAVQLSDSMTKAMFTERERAQGAYVMATSNRLQYLSNSDKLKVSSQMADRGIMTRNEIRDIWNLPPIAGGDAPTIRGEYYVMDESGNLVREGLDNASQSE